MQNSKKGLGRAKQFFWGFGFALPRLISRPQEGSGEECGRDSLHISFWNLGRTEKNTNSILCLGHYTIFDHPRLKGSILGIRLGHFR